VAGGGGPGVGLGMAKLPQFLEPVRRAYQDYLFPFLTVPGFGEGLARDEARLARLRDAVAAYPEGSFKSYYASVLFDRVAEASSGSAPQPALVTSRLAESAAAWLDAQKTPALFVTGLDELDRAAVCYAWAGSWKGRPDYDPVLLKKATEVTAERFARPGPPPKVVLTLAAMARVVVLPLDDRLARQVVAAWAEIEPDSPELAGYQAELAYRDEADAKAILLAGRALGVRADDPKWVAWMTRVRDRAAARLGVTLLPVAPPPRPKK
jgi:hypothetical protein